MVIIIIIMVCARDLSKDIPVPPKELLLNPAFYVKAYYYSIEGDKLTIVLTASSFKASG